MPTKHRIELNLLEDMMRVADDTKKAFRYDKSNGKWAWVDRDEVDVAEAYHGGHATFLAALTDAVEPYMPEPCLEEEDENLLKDLLKELTKYPSITSRLAKNMNRTPDQVAVQMDAIFKKLGNGRLIVSE